MFDSVRRVARLVSSVSDPPVTSLHPRPLAGGRPSLPEQLVARALPTSASATQLLPVIDALAPLLPGRGLQRGTVLVVDTGAVRSGLTTSGESSGSGPGGATTLSMALAAAASAAGSWCVAIGFGDPGVVAMGELGVDLEHLAIVPRPGHSWAGVTATALDGVDVVVLRLPFPARPAMARNLAARARERRSVLIVLAGEKAWPEGPDLVMRVEEGQWAGLGEGHGHLRTRRATVMAVGRRAAARPVRCRLWLPGPEGKVVPELGLAAEPAVPPPGVIDPAVQHGAVHPAISRHPAAMAVISGARRMHPSAAGHPGR
jgi:hypothetical protein